MSKKILLVGGGGHCKSVLDTLVTLNEYDEIGIIDKDENIGQELLGVKVLGCDEDLQKLYNEGFKYAFVTVGSVGNPSLRIKIYNNLKKIGFIIPTIIDKSSIISKFANIEEGVFIGKGCVVNSSATIGKCAIINTSSVIEHDCYVGDFVHLSPSATLCGNVTIKESSHIGANAVVKQGVEIGEKSIIGMGSVVLKDVKNSVVAYGNPCCEVKKI